jgi:hypothetical protein
MVTCACSVSGDDVVANLPENNVLNVWGDNAARAICDGYDTDNRNAPPK